MTQPIFDLTIGTLYRYRCITPIKIFIMNNKSSIFIIVSVSEMKPLLHYLSHLLTSSKIFLFDITSGKILSCLRQLQNLQMPFLFYNYSHQLKLKQSSDNSFLSNYESKVPTLIFIPDRFIYCSFYN